MSNPLFDQFARSPQNGVLERFRAFQQSFQGDPRQVIQNMLNSGQITQEQLNNAMRQAEQLKNFLK